MATKYDQFVKKIRKILNVTDGYPQECSVRWISGGVTGASCWGGTADQPIQPDTPKEIDDLDLILDILCPELTYKQSRNLKETIVKLETTGDADYYGNCCQSTKKYVLWKDLYDYLIIHKLTTI